MGDAASKKTRPGANGSDVVFVSPFYHEAKNEITRPDRAVFCSHYFVARWMPKLGATAVCIILYLRSLGGSVREGEVALQINQDDIAQAAQCSDRTVRREIAQNKALQRFVRIEDRYERGARGHVRRKESVYYVAMDDPLAEEDEPVFQEILGRKKPLRVTENKIIVDADVLGQNVLIRTDVIGQNDRIRDEIKSAPKCPAVTDKLSERNPKDSESYRNVSESRLRGNSGTDSGYIPVEDKARRMARKYGDKETPIETQKQQNPNQERRVTGAPSREFTPSLRSNGENTVEAWRRKSEELARYSASELGDQPSLGFHIKVWNHARKTDRQHPHASALTEAMFTILQNLMERRKQTGQPQGKAWTRRVRKLFEETGWPMLVKGDEAELQEVKAALAAAPFLQDDAT